MLRALAAYLPRLLLIEDEIGAIAALKRMLARAGHEVLVATNLPDALSAIDGQEVELGLTDSNSSCLIRSPGSSNARYVVMPMRL